MIVPSIDIMGGRAVQLVGGQGKALDCGDPLAIARKWRVAGELAVIDLDAAMGQGSNETIIREIVKVARCRVGGGIRSVERAIEWLDAGAEKVIFGTAATPGVLRELPRERVIAALDAVEGEVVVDGWRTKTGARVEDRITELREFASGFLVTFVEREGRMEGIDLDRVRELASLCGEARLTAAGGVTTTAEIAALDQMNVDAQVGMALYTKTLSIADALLASLAPADTGLWPTVVVDEYGIGLGLTWSNHESVAAAIESGAGVYWSRRRGLWQKGSTSGNTQELLRIDLDCDRDALRFTVRQSGPGFCHRNTQTCWGDDWGLPRLARRITQRAQDAPSGSYTRRLLDDPELLRAKLLEEAAELADADETASVRHEAADVIYFALVAMTRAGVSLSDVEGELAARERRVTRRAGDAKAGGRSASK